MQEKIISAPNPNPTKQSSQKNPDIGESMVSALINFILSNNWGTVGKEVIIEEPKKEN